MPMCNRHRKSLPCNQSATQRSDGSDVRMRPYGLYKFVRLAQNALNIRVLGSGCLARRGLDMNKPNRIIPDIPSSNNPKVSEAPTVTRSGSLVWNVRDIVFGPNRSPEFAKQSNSELSKRNYNIADLPD